MDKHVDPADSSDLPPADELPFVAPSRELEITAPFQWFALGWADFRATRKLSMIYGGILVLISYLLAFLSWQLGGVVLLFSLLSGLVFIAPVLALGLYSVSCQLEEGHKPKLAYCIREGKRHIGNELLYSLVLLIIFLVWVRAGSGIHIFFPMRAEPAISELLTFYAIGSAVGSIFATVVFCASAFSLPMMMDRETDAITAVITSTNAVIKNPLPMLVWALLIGFCVVACVLTAFLAMTVLIPVLGYATWHGYRQTIDASMWKVNKKINDEYPLVQK